MNKKIVFTGGHHNSALEVAKKLRQKGFEIVWFGHQQTMWREKSQSAEYREVTEAGFPFVNIKAGKFAKTNNLFILMKIPLGFFQAFFKLKKVKPALIVSFGGYLAVPVVLVGRLLGIPSVTHEQTVVSGLANRIIAPFVKKIFLTWEDSKKYFLKYKSEVVGLPLRKELLAASEAQEKQALTSKFSSRLPILFFIGGKQGSQIINQYVEDRLEKLLQNYNLVHQSGAIEKTGDFRRLSILKDNLPENLKKRYILKPYFYGKEMISFLRLADLVISRSGAHIVYELAVLNKPAILVPYPWSYRNEQEANARRLNKLTGALIVEQDNISCLDDRIKKAFLKDWLKRKPGLKLKTDAADILSERIIEVMKNVD